jgi:bacillithiol biosynthesis deacetylase BshB1
MKLDILAFGAHPDDVEFSCSGSLIKATKRGRKVGIITLTRAELGTRGDVKLRAEEFDKAAKIIGAEVHFSMGMPDGHITVTNDSKLMVIKAIRTYQPTIILLPYWDDRHPDHVNTSKMIQETAFLAGLKRIETGQDSFRPAQLIYYMSAWEFRPDFLIDISAEIEQKKQAILAYSSQVYNKSYNRPNEDETFISSPQFWDILLTRAAYYGQKIGKKYAEPFKIKGIVEVHDLVESFGDKIF